MSLYLDKQAGQKAHSALRTDSLQTDSQGTDTLRKDSYGTDSHGIDSHRPDSHGTDPHGKDSLRTDSHGTDPHRSDSHRSDSHRTDLPGQIRAVRSGFKILPDNQPSCFPQPSQSSYSQCKCGFQGLLIILRGLCLLQSYLLTLRFRSNSSTSIRYFQMRFALT